MRSRILVVSAVMLATCVGCENRSADLEEQTTDQVQDELRAGEILSAVVQQYDAATAYQDKAVLYLSYRLDGRAIQEPHPWSIAWDRNGHYSADLFNAKIRCDSKRLSCYVFDIESGNIDNQHLLVDAQRFGVLLDDPIASHFIFGTSELPLFEKEAEEKNLLIPPVIGFADQRLLPPWLTKPDEVRRLIDDESTGSKCYVIEMVESSRIYRMWIDQNSGMIEQVQLPLEYLDSQILASEQVSDLRFFVRFHDAAMNTQIDEQQFAIKKRMAAKIVKQFVTLPEPLPSERIGQQIRSWELLTSDGKLFELKDETKSTGLVWLVGGAAEEIIKELVELPPTIRKSVKVVYSDELAEVAAGDNFQPETELRRLLDQSGLQYLYDPQMKSSSQFKLKSVPSFVVLDERRRLQFAKPIDNTDWGRELLVAMGRVSDGEDLAAEIRQEYQQFLDSYHLRIARSETADFETVSNEFQGRKPKRLNEIASQDWELTEFQNSGNIHLQKSKGRAYVFDGWQTVVEVDVSGKIIERRRLPIPTDSAVNRICSIENGGQVYFAAYSMLGRQVFLFDENWSLLHQFPETGQSENAAQAVITACQFVKEAGDAALWIASMDGVFRMNLKSGELEKVGAEPARGFYRNELSGYLVHDSRLEMDGVAVDALAGWRIHAIAGFDGESNGCVVTAKNAAGSWQVFALNQQAQILWKASIEPQYLENEVQPLVVDGQVGVVLSSDGHLAIFSNEGIVGRCQIAGEASGVAFDQSQGRILISTGRRMTAWRLRDTSQTFFPASIRLNSRE